MVLRKPPPLHLDSLHKRNAQSASPASPSTTSPSHHRSRLNQAPSEDSIYSPDLNTSPAFDLMTLEEAQRSPVGSPTTYPPNPWTEGTEDRSKDEYTSTVTDTSFSSERRTSWQEIPSSLRPGSHAAMEDGWQQVPTPAQSNHNGSKGEVLKQLQSNNPFLKPRLIDARHNLTDTHDWSDRQSHTSTSSAPLSQTEGYIPMTARLSLLDSSEQIESPWVDHDLSPPGAPQPLSVDPPRDPSPWGSQYSINVSAPQQVYLHSGQHNPYIPASGVQPAEDYSGGQQPPPPASNFGLDAGPNLPSMASITAPATSHELIDLGNSTGASGVEPSSQQDPFHPSTGAQGKGKGEMSALASEAPVAEQTPQLPPRNVMRDKNPPLPARRLSPAEEARQMEQRAETYLIRQINWTNHDGVLLQSPILVQNKNGPCPLLALINALILRADPKMQPPIVRALQTREQISLGLLIEALFEELTTSLGPEDEFPDIEALAQFLTMLHTGMNVNPRLTLETVDSLGTFLPTSDLRSYGTFGVPLVHGWLASWSSLEHAAMTRIAQFHEDIQLLPFRKQELEDRIMRGESLTFEEEQNMADIEAIQKFVDIENATQLSPFGLTQLSTRLEPGSVSILFRNDHFSTLYKHPQSHQLFTLVTDAGYANHAEIVWESLVDVTGFNSEFLAGDFRAVGHGPSSSAGPGNPAGPHTSSTAATSASPNAEATQGPLSIQEQSDADYAYALSLQFQEEEQRERTPPQNSNSGTGNLAGREHRNSLPVRLSGPAAHMDNPPARTSSTGLRTRPPHANTDADDPNAPPPPYEQASGGQRHGPSPGRPTFDDIQTNANITTQRNPRNRYSQPVPNTSRYSSERSRNKDCVMM